MILKNWLDDGRVNYPTKGDFSIKKLISLMIMCLCWIQQGDWMMGRWNDFISIFIFNIFKFFCYHGQFSFKKKLDVLFRYFDTM